MFKFNVLKKLFTSGYGLLVTIVSATASFFAPEKYSFGLVLTAVLFDAFFGIWVSLKNGKFIISKLGRATTFKIVSYGASLVIVFMLERLAHNSGFIGVKVAAAWAVACEFWSMSASILVIWPDAVFFRIMRRHLKDEISAKLGENIDDLMPNA